MVAHGGKTYIRGGLGGTGQSDTHRMLVQTALAFASVAIFGVAAAPAPTAAITAPPRTSSDHPGCALEKADVRAAAGPSGGVRHGDALILLPPPVSRRTGDA